MEFNTPTRKLLEKQFQDKKLSESSIKTYIRNLEKLNNGPLKNLNFLKDISAILDKLQGYKENTKRSYLISIVSALGLDKSTKQKVKLYEDYFELMMDKNKKKQQDESKNEKTETQEKNWMDWTQVTKVFNDMQEKVKPLFNQKTVSDSQFNQLLSFMILSLYTLIAPRRNEYQHMFITHAPRGEDMNYLDIDKQQFVFNVFKTHKKEGQVVIDIPKELFQIIELYMKFHPLLKKKLAKNAVVPFLVHSDGEPLDKVNSITRILNRIFGKSIGSSMLRHSYLSSKYGTVSQEMKDDAKAMSHSVHTQQNTYVKND
jgi:integrase